MSTIIQDSDLDKRQNWELILETERILKIFDSTIENLQICVSSKNIIIILKFF